MSQTNIPRDLLSAPRVRQGVRRLRLVLSAVILVSEVWILCPERGRQPISLVPRYQQIHVGMTFTDVEQLMGRDRGFIPKGRASIARDLAPRSGSWGSTWMGNDMV